MPIGLRLTILGLIFIMSAGSLCAQWRKPRLYHLGPEQGMASWTFDIAQDSTGYMYFATDQGLVRYDGNNFELFAHIPDDTTSIGPGDVRCISASPDGLIWVGTRLGGFNSFDPLTLKFKRYPYAGLETNGYGSIRSINEDSEYVWIGGDSYNIHRFNKSTEQYESFQPDWVVSNPEFEKCLISEILQDKLNPDLLWITFLVFHPSYTEAKVSTLISFNKKTKQFIRCACWGRPKYQEPDGKIWLVSKGLNRFDPKTGQCDHFRLDFKMGQPGVEPWVRDFVFTGDRYLVSAPYAIAYFYPTGRYDSLQYGRDLGTVDDIFIDGQKNVWFGRNTGISVLSAQEEQIRYYPLEKYGLKERIYPGRLAYDPGTNTVFVVDHAHDGTGRRIFSISLESDDSRLYFDSPSPVTGIALDTSKNLWINRDGNFYKADLRSGKKPERVLELNCGVPIPRFWNLTMTPDGWMCGLGTEVFIWFKPGQACRILDRNKIPNYPVRPINTIFQGVFYTRNQEAILFSNQAVLLDLVSGKTTPLIIETGVQQYPDIDINSVIEDSRGHIWVSTLEMTAEFRRSGDSLKLIKKYTTQDGLKSAWAHELYPDRQGRIWAFSQTGIQAIDPLSGEVRSFGVKEGLVNPYIDPRQILEIQDGRLITVDGPGIIVFHPDSLWNAYTRKEVPVVIKDIRISGERVLFTTDINNISELVLKPGEDYIDIQFQALVYPTDYNLTYSYKVEDLHPDWISLGENKIVTMSSLSPGDYLLKIKAGKPDSPAPEKTLLFRLPAPFYRQPWFILGCSLFGLGALISIYRWRIHNIRHQEAEKAYISKQMRELELNALRAQMNPHFMFNSLNSIKNYIFKAEPKLAAEYLSNFAHLIRMILQNSKEKTITLEKEIETLILYIELEQVRFENKFEFNCIIEEGLDIHQVMIPPLLLQPFVENAIWHGLMHKKENGHLLLHFYKTDRMINCIIDDDGVGRKKAGEMKKLSATKYKSMGIGITKDRIDIMNKMDALNISAEIIDKVDESSNPLGTRVKLTIPGPDYLYN